MGIMIDKSGKKFWDHVDVLGGGGVREFVQERTGGGGVKKGQNFADFLYGRPLSTQWKENKKSWMFFITVLLHFYYF
jgi:hypothetical protein